VSKLPREPVKARLSLLPAKCSRHTRSVFAEDWRPAPPQAEALIRARLEDAPDEARLWCALGDLRQDDGCYRAAWERSGRRSARAQRSLARRWAVLVEVVCKGRFCISVTHLPVITEVHKRRRQPPWSGGALFNAMKRAVMCVYLYPSAANREQRC
jgi:hypothetical protein